MGSNVKRKKTREKMLQERIDRGESKPKRTS